MTTLVASQHGPEGSGEKAPEPVAPGPEQAPREAPSQPARHDVAVSALGLLSLLFLGFVVYLLAFSGISQSRAQSVMYKNFRHRLAQATAPVGPVTRTGGRLPSGTPIAVLDIPGLRLRQVVVEGTASGDLMNGPGHRPATAFPGQPGVAVITGRRAAYGGPFRTIDALRPGDPLTVYTGQGMVPYRVERVRHDTDPLPQPVGAGGARLILATADDPLWPTKAIYVDAWQTSPVQQTAGSPSVEADADKTMASDPAALLPLVLWSQALALLAPAITWSRVRWGRWQTHLAAIPLLAAVVWNVYENTARLLPNVL
ncbi:sortase [Actinoallomurus vinaceus]|uniref:Sortase n=1 Tax=Actinoallomurus vinaceus TaxID=1080074 RepID=A0ABP8U9U1_9ACTN